MDANRLRQHDDGGEDEDAAAEEASLWARAKRDLEHRQAAERAKKRGDASNGADGGALAAFATSFRVCSLLGTGKILGAAHVLASVVLQF